MIGILFSLAQAEEDKEGILKVINEIDPDPGVETSQIQGQIEKGINAGLEQFS